MAEIGWGPFRWLAERLAEVADAIFAKLVQLWFSIWGNLREMGDTVIDELISAASVMFPDLAGQWSANSGLLGKINYFFPLSETVAMATILLGLWSLTASYKLLKSWLPKVSS